VTQERPDQGHVDTAASESSGAIMDKEFRDVLEASSLGTPAARRIRSMTPDEVVDDVYRRMGRRDQTSLQPQSPAPTDLAAGTDKDVPVATGQTANLGIDVVGHTASDSGHGSRRRGRQRRHLEKPGKSTRLRRAGLSLSVPAFLAGLGYLGSVLASGAGVAGLVVALTFVLFTAGFLLGALLVVAVGIRAEDKAAMRRRDGSILLHEEPVSHLTRGVLRLYGVGQRTGPEECHSKTE